MKLPDNIRKLLSSINHEDRAIGISLLEKIPDYKNLFSEIDTSVANSKVLFLNETHNQPTTLVKGISIYWINTGTVFMWLLGPKECHWSGANVIISI